MRIVKARFANGVMERLELLDRDEGQEVVLLIDDRLPVDHIGPTNAGGGWRVERHRRCGEFEARNLRGPTLLLRGLRRLRIGIHSSANQGSLNCHIATPKIPASELRSANPGMISFKLLDRL